jgi:urease accessory protein
LTETFTTTLAHAGAAAHDFAAGLSHPFTGWDHLLAMLAAGLWASRFTGQARFALPAAFLAAMAAGSMLAAAAVPLPLVEPVILVSVLVFGLLLATAQRLPAAAAVLLSAAFAVFHGHAHAAELPAGGAVAPYTAGFLIGSTSLLALGLATGGAARSPQGFGATRWFGAATATAALVAGAVRL